MDMTWAWYLARNAIGRGAAQNHYELATLLLLIESQEIESIIEVGTFTGGTAWAFAQIPSVKRVVTIDIVKPMWPDYGDKVTFIHGDSAEPDIIAKVEETMAGNKPDFLFIDGGHSARQVRADWNAYGYAVQERGMIAFHDVGIGVQNAEVQVRRQWLEISTPYPHVEIFYSRSTSPGTGVLWRMKG